MEDWIQVVLKTVKWLEPIGEGKQSSTKFQGLFGGVQLGTRGRPGHRLTRRMSDGGHMGPVEAVEVKFRRSANG